ncbi:three-Cys-motif partner protein TcmP [Alcaligenes nematophilus]|uniref:three-Cys-motif partner protein TcmP n=1 Tax=Alcaligenes nematophilus TaxID=2994643 RepID=UPI0034E09263
MITGLVCKGSCVAKSHYDWSVGPAEIEEHSLTKHDVLVGYLRRYFERRTLNGRGQERLRLTLVDGFCGGGLYTIRSTGKEVLGSPLRMLDCVRIAQEEINRDRLKAVELEIQYIFVDEDSQAIAHLHKVLEERGYGGEIGKSIHIMCSDFVKASPSVMQLIRGHTPRTPRALFFLDQYGYTDVPASLIRNIFKELDKSEIVLTFHVSAFGTYANDVLVGKISDTLDIDLRTALGNRSIEEIKNNEADWRRFIQAALYKGLVTDCSAQFFTPFFIRGVGSGHGEYWLVHLSQHPQAQDVMKQVHWGLQNHFVHYGGAGLDMLAPQTMGFNQAFTGGFRFDDVARHQSDIALIHQLGQVIYRHGQPLQIGELFANTCNTTPATARMYNNALEQLVGEKDIIVVSADGKRRRHAHYMRDSDIIERNPQLQIVFPPR